MDKQQQNGSREHTRSTETPVILTFGDSELWSIKVMVGPFLNSIQKGININSYSFAASLLIYFESTWDVSWSFCSEVSFWNWYVARSDLFNVFCFFVAKLQPPLHWGVNTYRPEFNLKRKDWWIELPRSFEKELQVSTHICDKKSNVEW